jgi:hypothetical protein
VNGRIRSFSIAANLLPVALLFHFIHRYGVDVPLRDEWDAYVLLTFGRMDRGVWRLRDLFAQHNEHRILLPRLLTLANAALFHWDRRVEMYATACLLVLAAGVLYRFTRAYWNDAGAPLYFIPVIWTLLTWRQWENLLFGFQVQIALVVAGAVVTFCLLQGARGARGMIWPAAATALAATYSFAAGLLLWPVGLIQLVLRQVCGAADEKPRRAAIVIWAAAGALAWAAYFRGYHAPQASWPHGLGYVLRHPLAAAQYLAILIGAPLSLHFETARTLGVLVTLLAAFSVAHLVRFRRAEVAGAGPLLALILFMLASGLTICTGRLGLGALQALSSRYCSVTTLGLVAVYALLVKCCLPAARPSAWLACGGMAALLVSGAMTSTLGWPDDPDPRNYLEAAHMGVYAIEHADVVAPDAFLALHPWPNNVRQGIEILRRHGYSLFHTATAPETLPARFLGETQGCAIDGLNGSQDNPYVLHQASASGLKVEGWAVDRQAGELPRAVFLSVDGKLDFPAVGGRTRLDVATALQNEHYREAGVMSYPRAGLLPEGEHTVEWKIVSHDGGAYWTCAGSAKPRVIQVVE